MRLVLALVLVVLLNAVPGESRASSPSHDPASSSTAVISPTPVTTSTDDASLNSLLTENHERSAYLLPLIEADTSLLPGQKRTKERLVEIRPLHSKRGKDPVALILTSDIPVHRKPKKLHVILDSHDNRHKKNLYKNQAPKHYFLKPHSSEENYSDEEHDHSGYDTNEDFSDEDNSLSKENNVGSYSSEELGQKKKNFSKILNIFHGFTSGANSQEENVENQNKYSKTFKQYRSVSGDSSKHSGKHHYWNKYFSQSGSGGDESRTNGISKEDIVLIEPQNHKERTESYIPDGNHSSSAGYHSYKRVDTDSEPKNNEFSNENNSESNELHGNKDAEDTVQNIQQSNQYKNSNKLSGESPIYENSDEVVDHEVSEESNEIENPVDTILILGKEQLAENLYVQNLNSELEESHGNTNDKLVILNDDKSFSSSKEHTIQDVHESFETKEVASHSAEYSESVDNGNNNEDITKLLTLILGHEDAVSYDDNHHHHHHESNGQDSSDKDSVLYESESLNIEEYLNDDNDSKGCTGEILLPAEHTQKHYDDIESHDSQINHLISQLLEEQSSLDSSKQIVIHDLSGEDKSIEDIIEVIKAPKHTFKKSLEDDCGDETVELMSSLQKTTDSHNEAHKTYKLSFRFNR